MTKQWVPVRSLPDFTDNFIVETTYNKLELVKKLLVVHVMEHDVYRTHIHALMESLPL